MAEERNIETENIPEDLPGIRGFLQRFRADYDAHDHSGSNSRAFKTLKAETLASRAISIRKSSYTDNTSGMWAGLVGNTMKMFLGSASAYMKWTGTALQIAGDIVAGSLTIGTGASIDSSGNATFISMTSLNMKAYTCFETIGRFITAFDVTATFGNQGMTVAPGATANHYSQVLWWITQYVFNNNPSFTCSLLALSDFESSDGRAFVGLGKPTITGGALTLTGVNYCGFLLSKTTGVTTLVASQCDGSGSRASANLTTILNNDSIELFLKMTSTGISYRYRKNGGAISAETVLTTFIPTGSETYISFMCSNTNSSVDFKPQFQTAAYEH